MTEYLTKEQVLKTIDEIVVVHPVELGCLNEVREAINKIHVSDVAPVIHGKWLKTSAMVVKCSNCRYIVQSWGTNYCPSCGAKMRKKG